jgi:hypothetical protein
MGLATQNLEFASCQEQGFSSQNPDGHGAHPPLIQRVPGTLPRSKVARGGGGVLSRPLTSKYFIIIINTNKQTPWSESASELYRPGDRRLSAK